MNKNLVKFFKKLMASSLIRKYDVIIVILMLRQLKSGKSSCFFVFGWIKLKLGLRGNFRLLISNLNSKMQYQFEMLRKMPLFFSSIMIFSPALPHKLVTMATINDLSSIF